MNKHILVIFQITVIFLFIFYAHNNSVAVDTKGCLTCHRYPGLVRLEPSDSFKVLHIDEEEHLDSTHGKVECWQCHPNVSQIPHTGVTDVDCTTSCHVKDRDKIASLDSSYYEDYHKNEKFAITYLDDKSSCRVCHPLYPHSENKKVRAFVNMHTGYLLCEVCHLKKDELKNLFYDWKSPEHFRYIGEPYGTHHGDSASKSAHSEKIIQKMLKIYSPYDDHTGEKHDRNNFIFRIAAFTLEDGEKKLLMNTGDCGKAEEFRSRGSNLTPDEKKKELEYFHRDIARKEISVACNECHSPKGILDFSNLGFDENRVKDLQYLNIKSLVTKYKTFYFPNLFGH